MALQALAAAGSRLRRESCSRSQRAEPFRAGRQARDQRHWASKQPQSRQYRLDERRPHCGAARRQAQTGDRVTRQRREGHLRNLPRSDGHPAPLSALPCTSLRLTLTEQSNSVRRIEGPFASSRAARLDEAAPTRPSVAESGTEDASL